MLRRIRQSTLALAVGAGLVTGILGPPAMAAPAGSAEIEVLSSRADTISAGNALVRVSGLKNHDRILVAGVDLTDAFQPTNDGRVGLVEGLPLGESRIVVEAVSGKEQGGLDVVNHPRSGPLFSGPQHKLYCQATGLGVLDEDCMTDNVVVRYKYRSTGNQVADYPTDGTVPPNVATTTVNGVEVPYIYRLERGTINRSLYEIAILHEPGTPGPTPWNATPGWNSKLVYTFGGACGVPLGQGTSTGGVENHDLLSKGYAVASGSLNVFATNCDDVVSAETASMVKEHFIESYGVPLFTMGWGGSAGTMQQLLLANNYPGIIDGVIGQIGYPDERTTTITGHDCRALTGFWGTPEGAGWSNAQKTAVTGHAVVGTCNGYMFFDGVDNPQRGCPAVVPLADRWPTNPGGIRCTISDLVSNVYGVDDDGKGLRTIPDAIGVQFGLQAFHDDVITAEQFLALNAGVRGIDIDGNSTAERSEASVAAIERGFATGRFNVTSGGLGYTPVIEFRQYTDPTGDFHDSYRSAVLRERMLEAHGDAGTHVSWRGAGGTNGVMTARALEKMDEWLTNLVQVGELGQGSRAATIAARPSDIEDGCYTDSTTFVAAELDWYASGEENPCNAAFPFHADPRIKAGAPLTIDVLKCELGAPSRSDYPELTDDQWAQLNDVFSDGVCDYTQPSQGRVELEGTWLSFGPDQTVALGTPQILGTPRVGDELSASVSAPQGAALEYQWMIDGVVVPDATGQTLTLVPEHQGKHATVRVTASLDGYVSTSEVSDPSKKIRFDNRDGAKGR